MVSLNRLAWLAALAWPSLAAAQTTPDMAAVLDKLDRIERQNAALNDRVRALEEQLAALRAAPGPATAASATPAPPETPHIPTPDERLDVQQQRIEEQAQTKVEASQKFPIRLTGMVLFNTFLDSRQSGGADYPTVAAATGTSHAGATLRQSIIGLEYRGPKTFWGGQVHGNLQMDFYTSTNTLAQSLRIRTASIEIDWAHDSLMVGLEKPIFNPREPASLAQVGVSPLTGAGNLWLWLPQVRLEHDLGFTASSGVRAQLGVVETKESPAYSGSVFTGAVEPSRPGLEGRFEFYYKLDGERRFEFAPGFHLSTTHVAGLSVPSQVVSADWFFNPWQRVELTGALFAGHNVANLGTGGINEGFAVFGRDATAIGAAGGWGQITLHAAPRADLHLFVGRQEYNSWVLDPGDTFRNFQFGANVFFRLAPNVLLGPEISQLRTYLLNQSIRINNHYDLALAYLF
jgi:hypothetical protein